MWSRSFCFHVLGLAVGWRFCYVAKMPGPRANREPSRDFGQPVQQRGVLNSVGRAYGESLLGDTHS
jgi:hypothetical protein